MDEMYAMRVPPRQFKAVANEGTLFRQVEANVGQKVEDRQETHVEKA